MTSHSIEDSKYREEFLEVLEGYAADDPETISYCQDKASVSHPRRRREQMQRCDTIRPPISMRAYSNDRTTLSAS